ncbi:MULTISPECIES: hypothetical protein [unclassified Mycolicibacterium]|uniref:hypothetical protein n=1 Tax=unclassified Mycolicibacterium TaxID=2636767 RepID=UPI00130A24BE|nr:MULTISPECIES: hypothetical protein [unclassified Mycolicibacterium]MUL85483.1 hypothetical protein [Mycolicibacterium sp. CBMA 329]MUL88753.1 hypothetical protein [Mycolicibacterium sp. CBMA 331]MUM01953.1 hypothetical protein [Mycolicibacterium sp. CBMA 334]MUM29224.1 hypothetical protein [Mycolicibacterium sp. CBMA 295]MUM40400.1 hypothetical protein [Mycolicibacterium sp. CBMA 247]
MNVAPDELTGSEQAVLLVLMAESRPVSNPELERLGPKLDKPQRDRLNRLGLIETTGTRPLVHELTDAGWALCRALFGADTPPRSTGQGKALYTLLGALHRYFQHAELVPADVFLPAKPSDQAPGADHRNPEVQLRTAYAGLAARPGGWVSLLRLRQAVPGLPRPTVDAALISLYQQPGVSLIPEENQKVLTPADRDAAVEIGNQNKHLIAIES